MPTSSRTLLANLTPRGRMVLGGCLVALVAVVFLGLQIAGRPSYALIATGMDPAQTGKVTTALDEKGIAYELRNNGTGLAVEKSQTAQARIALAGQDLGSGSAQPGFELFDKQKLGSSDFQQQVTYQRALEGQVAKTIEQVQGVTGAQVRLVLAEDSLFAESSTPATAAVLLTSAGTGLEPSAVRGIAQLVSSSVKGLKPSNVSITDGAGELLWPRGEGDAGGEGTLSKQTVQARYETQVEAGIMALLTRTVGAGKAEVQVNADVNADQATRDELKYGEGTPLKETTESEKLKGGAGSAGAAAGTTANIPGYAQGAAAAGGGTQGYDRSSRTREFGVDKTVTRTKVAPGAVNKLNVALVVDRSVPAPELSALEAAVASAAGIDRGRGDTLAVTQVAFAKDKASAAPGAIGGPAAAYVPYAKYAAAGLALLGFLWFSARHLRRREEETLLREPRWLSEIEAPTTLAQLERPRPSTLPERADHPARQQIEELAEREPERVAQQIRTWMRDA